MNVRIAYNYWRLYRGFAALLLILTCMMLGFSFAVLTILCLIGWLKFTNWYDLLWPAIGLVFLGVGLLALLRRPFKFFVLSAFGLKNHREGKYAESEALARLAWKYADEILERDHPSRGESLAQLCRVTRAQGNYDDAELFGLKWVDEEEATWGSDHRFAIWAILEVADIYLEIARYIQAKPLLEKALLTLDAKPTDDPFALAFCLNKLGRMWSDLDRDEEAEPYMMRAFEIVQKLPERTSETGINITLGVAVAHAVKGNLDKSEAILKGEYEPIRKKYGPESWQVAYWIESLSRLRSYQKRYAEAEKLNRQALAIIEKECKSNSQWLISSRHGLANRLSIQEKWTEAEDCYRKALQLCEEFSAPENPSIARLLEDYAELLERLSRFDEALVHKQHAQQIRDFHSPFRNF